MHGAGLSNHALATIASARRATALARMAAADLTVEIRPLDSLHCIVEPWQALAARALEPNIFHEPAFALAAAPVFGAGLQAGLVWSQGPPRELIGLFPVRVQSRRYGLPMPVLSGWTHPYAPLGTPLVHRDIAEPAIAAWFDHLASDPAMPALMLLPYLAEDGAVASVIDSILARRGSATASFERHRRALLAPNDARSDYLRRAIAPKRRKELSRQMRRLQDRGQVTVDRAGGPAARAALDDFLRIEASGWKGRSGSAAGSNPDIRRFVESAVAGLAARDAVAVYRLLLAQQPIAAAITLRSGANAWCWKIAYDETYARLSPGTHLIIRVTEDLLRDPGILRTDSLATANHPLIDHIWNERMTVADRLIALRPDAFVPFALACRLESIRRLGIGAARAVRGHLRG
jgi:CelD/BcsL family acetyltransferase involved in cellulose biosynthesis